MGGDVEDGVAKYGGVVAARDAHRVAGELYVRERRRSNATIHDEVPLRVRVLRQTHRVRAEVALVVAAADVAPVDELLADEAHDGHARHRVAGGEEHIRRREDLVDVRVRNNLVLGRRRDRQLDPGRTQRSEEIRHDLAVVDKVRSRDQLGANHVAPAMIAHVKDGIGR